MKIEEMHKNLYKALIEDEKYQQIMGSIENEDEKTQLTDFMKRFMNYFQTKMFDPLVERAEKDPEFKDAIAKKIETLIPSKDKE